MFYNKQGCKQTKWNWIPLCKLLWDVCWADVTVIKSLNHRCERQSEIDPCAVHREASFVCVCEGVEKWLLSPSVLFCDPDPYSAGTHTLWQPVQFTLTVDRTTGSELDTRPCVCVCVCVFTWSHSRACSCTDAGYPENLQLMKPNISSMEKGRGHSSISNILL